MDVHCFVFGLSVWTSDTRTHHCLCSFTGIRWLRTLRWNCFSWHRCHTIHAWHGSWLYLSQSLTAVPWFHIVAGHFCRSSLHNLFKCRLIWELSHLVLGGRFNQNLIDSSQIIRQECWKVIPPLIRRQLR